MNFRRPPSASPFATLCPFMQVPLALARPLKGGKSAPKNKAILVARGAATKFCADRSGCPVAKS